MCGCLGGLSAVAIASPWRGADRSPIDGTVRATAFVLEDGRGNALGRLEASKEGPRLILYSTAGTSPAIELGVSRGASKLWLHGSEATGQIELTNDDAGSHIYMWSQGGGTGLGKARVGIHGLDQTGRLTLSYPRTVDVPGLERTSDVSCFVVDRDTHAYTPPK